MGLEAIHKLLIGAANSEVKLEIQRPKHGKFECLVIRLPISPKVCICVCLSLSLSVRVFEKMCVCVCVEVKSEFQLPKHGKFERYVSMCVSLSVSLSVLRCV